MNDEHFLILLIVVLRIADGVTSYIPANGLLLNVGEANPVAIFAIERWGYVSAFVIITVISLAFVLAFVLATHLEEARRVGNVDYAGVHQIRRFRIGGLICLALLSSFPLFVNLAVAISIS